MTETNELTPQGEVDKQLELARLQRENLELEAKLIQSRIDEQRRIADKERNQALQDFYSMDAGEMEKLPLANRSGISQAKPATIFWQSTVFYYKPSIQRGKLVGKKIAILVKAGRYVRADMVNHIKEVEKKYAKLNEVERQKLEMIAKAQGKKFRKGDSAWFIGSDRQNTVKIEDLTPSAVE